MCFKMKHVRCAELHMCGALNGGDTENMTPQRGEKEIQMIDKARYAGQSGKVENVIAINWKQKSTCKTAYNSTRPGVSAVFQGLQPFSPRTLSGKIYLCACFLNLPKISRAFLACRTLNSDTAETVFL